MPEQKDNSLIHFACQRCGQKIRVPQIHAGKKAKCPKCKNTLVVPKANREETQKPQKGVLYSKDSSGYNLTFLKTTQMDKVFEQQNDEESSKDEQLNRFRQISESEDIEPPKRKLPWLIDIFLYPTSSHGFMILAIIFGIPLLIDVVVMLLGPFGFFISIPGFIVKIIIGLYAYWYIGECIRDSAEGNIRAPDVIAASPGFGEMFAGWFKIITCLILYVGPVGIYFLHTRNINVIFWSLLAYAIFFFPIGLLAAVMFEYMSGFNPFLLIASVFRIFFQYCGLVFLLCTFVFLSVKTVSVLPQIPILNSLYTLAFLCLLMIMAHLLGRFYFRYKDKLNWDV